jgi:spermidine/putrescine transport system permease protein
VRGHAARGLALALPALALYTIFFVVPLLVIGVYSFGYKPPLEAGRAIGLDRWSLDNYRETLTGVFAEVFVATLTTAAVGTALCLLIGFPVAYALSTRVSNRWKAPLLALVILPSWTSFLLRTVAWRILLAGNGPLSTALQGLAVLGGPLQILDTRAAVQLGVVYNYLPLMILPLFVALERQDPRLREASKDLGASPWDTFVHVTLPLAMPGVVAGTFLVFIPLAGEYVTPTILGGVRGIMAGSLIASQFLEAQHWALGSAQAVVLIALVLAVVAGARGLVSLTRWAAAARDRVRVARVEGT